MKLEITFAGADPHIQYRDMMGQLKIEVYRGMRQDQMVSLLQLYKLCGFKDIKWSMGTK